MSAAPKSPLIPWSQGVAALFVGLSGGTLAGLALGFLLTALEGGMQAMPFALMFAPFLIAAAIMPALLASLLLRYKRWLRLSQFLAAGGASAAFGPGVWLLPGGAQALQNGAGLIVLAFFAGVAGGASAWAYLKLKQLIPSRPAP